MRKLKYLYTDHNARPHTVTKRLSERQCVCVRERLSSVCQLTPRERVTNLTVPEEKSSEKALQENFIPRGMKMRQQRPGH